MIAQGIVLIVIAVLFCRMASCFFVVLDGKNPAAWLRVSSCIFVVNTPPQGFAALRG